MINRPEPNSLTNGIISQLQSIGQSVYDIASVAATTLGFIDVEPNLSTPELPLSNINSRALQVRNSFNIQPNSSFQSPWFKVDPNLKPTAYRFAINELQIFGTKSRDCAIMVRLLNSLENSELGRVILKCIEEDIKLNRLILIAHPESKITHQGLNGLMESLGLYGGYEAKGIFRRGICIPMKNNPFNIKLTWCHEITHYLFSRIHPNGLTCPLNGLPLKDKSSFIFKYFTAKKQFSHNPHPQYSPKWKMHNYVRDQIFNNPFALYAKNKRATEIVAFCMQFELAYPGILKRFGLHDLSEGVKELIHKRIPNGKIGSLPGVAALDQRIDSPKVIGYDQLKKANP